MNHPEFILNEDFGDANIVRVSDSEQLKSALANAKPGDIIMLNDETYRGDFTLSKSGEERKPIVVRAKNVGKAVFKDSLFTMRGDNCIVGGMTFDDGQVTVKGNHNRVTRNVFKNGERGGNGGKLNSAVLVEGSNNRVDHNEVANWHRRGLRVVPNQGIPKNNRIDHNYLHHFQASGNAGDAFQIGSNKKHTRINTETIIEHNLVERAEADAELLSVKSSGSIIRFNTFKNSDATVQIRHGTNNQLIGNTVISLKAMAIYGEDNKVIGNKLESTPLIIRCGDIMQSELANGEKGHPAARNTHVEGNNVVDSFIGVGVRIPKGSKTRGVAARNTKLINNEGNIKRGEPSDQRDTEISDEASGLPILQAQLVGSNDVGPAAVADSV